MTTPRGCTEVSRAPVRRCRGWLQACLHVWQGMSTAPADRETGQTTFMSSRNHRRMGGSPAMSLPWYSSTAAVWNDKPAQSNKRMCHVWDGIVTDGSGCLCIKMTLARDDSSPHSILMVPCNGWLNAAMTATLCCHAHCLGIQERKTARGRVDQHIMLSGSATGLFV